MSEDTSVLYGIGTVARLTGLTTHSIRAWENRYQAVEPERGESGRRRYSPEQVERLSKLKQLVDLGERISALAQLPNEKLDERLTDLSQETGNYPQPLYRLRVGIYGPTAPALAKSVSQNNPQCKVIDVSTTATPRELETSRPDVDCLIIETSSLAPDLVSTLERLGRQSADRAVILIYAFARDIDLRQLARSGIIIVRSPVGRDDLSRALIECAQGVAAAGALQQMAVKTGIKAEHEGSEERFSARQLSRIGSISTSIDCECPHHLVTLINNLRAFERYSKDCTSLNRADSAVHEYLYRETVRANQVIENALRYLLDYEKISLDE